MLVLAACIPEETAKKVIEVNASPTINALSTPTYIVPPTPTYIAPPTVTKISEVLQMSQDYGVNPTVLNVEARATETIITVEVKVDKRWNMSADWQLTPPNGILMHSLEYPRLHTKDGQAIQLLSVQSDNLRDHPDGGVIATSKLSFEPLPINKSEFVLQTNVEFSEVRSVDPLVLDLSESTNNSEWMLSKTVSIGEVTYAFSRAKLTNNRLELFSDGIIEDGYQTIAFYSMTEYEPSPQIAYANGGSGNFDDPDVPLVSLEVGELLDGEIELYFRSSIRTLIPYQMHISLKDYQD